VNPRRAVRVTESFFDRLDELLTADRTVAGGPSATDFLLHEMPAIIDSLALAFEASTHPVADREDLRVLVSVGVLVGFVAVYAVLAPDDAVEIIYLEIENG
jgi:hypothetical protein